MSAINALVFLLTLTIFTSKTT